MRVLRLRLETLGDLAKAQQLDMFGEAHTVGKRKPGEVRQAVKAPSAAQSTGNLFGGQDAAADAKQAAAHEAYHAKTGMDATQHNVPQLLRDLAKVRKPGASFPEAEHAILGHLDHIQTHHPELTVGMHWDRTPRSGKAPVLQLEGAGKPKGAAANAGGQGALFHGTEGPGGQAAMFSAGAADEGPTKATQMGGGEKETAGGDAGGLKPDPEQEMARQRAASNSQKDPHELGFDDLVASDHPHMTYGMSLYGEGKNAHAQLNLKMANLRRAHEKSVRDALKSGKTVPPHVLAQYPGIVREQNEARHPPQSPPDSQQSAGGSQQSGEQQEPAASAPEPEADPSKMSLKELGEHLANAKAHHEALRGQKVRITADTIGRHQLTGAKDHPVKAGFEGVVQGGEVWPPTTFDAGEKGQIPKAHVVVRGSSGNGQGIDATNIFASVPQDKLELVDGDLKARVKERRDRLDQANARYLEDQKKKLQDANERNAAATEHERQERGQEAAASEVLRHQHLGTTAVPGVRLDDAEGTGRVFDGLKDGSVSPEQWGRHVEDLMASGKAPREYDGKSSFYAIRPSERRPGEHHAHLVMAKDGMGRSFLRDTLEQGNYERTGKTMPGYTEVADKDKLGDAYYVPNHVLAHYEKSQAPEPPREAPKLDLTGAGGGDQEPGLDPLKLKRGDVFRDEKGQHHIVAGQSKMGPVAHSAYGIQSGRGTMFSPHGMEVVRDPAEKAKAHRTMLGSLKIAAQSHRYWADGDPKDWIRHQPMPPHAAQRWLADAERDAKWHHDKAAQYDKEAAGGQAGMALELSLASHEGPALDDLSHSMDGMSSGQHERHLVVHEAAANNLRRKLYDLDEELDGEMGYGAGTRLHQQIASHEGHMQDIIDHMKQHERAQDAINNRQMRLELSLETFSPDLRWL